MGRRLLTVLSAPVGIGLLLAVEIVYAVRAERLPSRAPYQLSGRVEGPGPPITMAWIGDSVTAGVGASGPEATLPRLVARGLGRTVDLHVFAVSGARVATGLAEQVPQVEELRPDVVVVELGANDVIHLTSRFDFRLAYGEILARVSKVGARHVLALGTPAFGTTPRFLQPLRAIAGWRSRVLDAEVRAAASAFGATYVDIAGGTRLELDADPAGTHADDRFHPNDAGYELWADAVLDRLLPLLARG